MTPGFDDFAELAVDSLDRVRGVHDPADRLGERQERTEWRGIEDLELATLEWVDWFNHHRIFHPIGRIPPAEHEENYYRHNVSDHQVETQTKQPA